jgi:predicted secreted Zn-dependent protease
MRMPRIIAAWAVAFAGIATFAVDDALSEVYRWTDENGKVHYGDRPPEEAKAKSVDTAKMDSTTTGGTAGDVRVLATDVEWFAIHGTTRSEMRLAMQRNGPYSESKGTKVWGQCAWRIRWKFEHDRGPGRCAVKGVALEVSARMWLPKWDDETRAPAELRSQWQEFARKLRTHEDGHKNNGIAAAQDMARRIRGLGAYADCDALNRDISRLGERVISEYRKVDEAFDRVEYLYATGF